MQARRRHRADGVPLPHTNILAKNRGAIAEAAPRFLSGFVREETIAVQLGSVDFAGKVEKLLSDPETRGDTNEFIRARLSALLAPAARPGGESSAAFLASVREVVGFIGERLTLETHVADPIRDQLKSSFRRFVSDPVTAVHAARLLAFLMDRLHAVLEPQSRGFTEGAERLEAAFVSQLRGSAAGFVGSREGLYLAVLTALALQVCRTVSALFPLCQQLLPLEERAALRTHLRERVVDLLTNGALTPQ